MDPMSIVVLIIAVPYISVYLLNRKGGRAGDIATKVWFGGIRAVGYTFVFLCLLPLIIIAIPFLLWDWMAWRVRQFKED